MREHYHMILPSVQFYKIWQLGENRDYNIIAKGWGFWINTGWKVHALWYWEREVYELVVFYCLCRTELDAL